jgi:hypothetical protein
MPVGAKDRRPLARVQRGIDVIAGIEVAEHLASCGKAAFFRARRGR